MNQPSSLELSKVSSNGQLLFSYHLPTQPQYGFSMATAGNDLYVGFGNRDSFTLENLTVIGAEHPEWFLMKFNEIGFPQWVVNARGSEEEVNRNVIFRNEALFIAGEYESNTLRLGDKFIYNNSGNGNKDIFLAKLRDNQTETICPEETTLDVSIPSSFCHGDYAVSFNTEYFTSVKWYRDNQALPFDGYKSIPIDKPGIYRIEVNSEFRCPLEPFEFEVVEPENDGVDGAYVMSPLPEAKIDAPEIINSNRSYIFSTPFNENYQYEWVFSSGNVISGSNSNESTVFWESPDELVTVQLQVTNMETGCQALDEYQFQIETILNAKDESFNTIIYPNPTSSTFQIRGDHKIINLVDASGKKIELDRFGDYYQLNHLKPGLYYLTVEKINNSQPQIIKLIKL